MSDEKNKFAANYVEELAALNENPPRPQEMDQIIGWQADREDDLAQLGLPSTSGTFVYVVGAEALEWPIKKCKSHHIYLISKENLIGDTDEKCYAHKVQVWRKTDDVRLWQAGFASLDEPRYTEFGPVSKTEHTEEVTVGGEPLPESEEEDAHILASISSAYNIYTNSCDCGDRYADNCAHFISNALIKAGYSMGSGEKCRCGRMIRAKELLRWVQRRPGRRFAQNHNRLPSGIWVVYQERSDGQAHILFHRELPDKYYWKGTGDYDGWPVQWHYSF